jgi:hypothetical protein
MDFTIKKYTVLLEQLKKSGYSFQTVAGFIQQPEKKVVVLRHDVDDLPFNSLKFAMIQNKMDIKGSYYFRVIPSSFDMEIIQEISNMGHEIGYHYETMDTCNGNVENAYNEFCRNLELFRKIVPVNTICMHGSPASHFDNREIWSKYNYKQMGITAEPYFDIDYNKVFYLTDTGRRFDGEKVSVRDKPMEKIHTSWPSYHKLDEIINALHKNSFPDVVMMALHPQRWSDNILFWAKELILQNLKNTVKRHIVKRNHNKPKQLVK